MKNRYETPYPEIFEDLGQISHIEGFSPITDVGAEAVSLPLESSAVGQGLIDRLRRHPVVSVASIGALAMGAGLASRGALAHIRHA